jgi:hypothetical protein
MSVITWASAENPLEPWPFLLHLNVSAGVIDEPRVVWDDGGGDSDLLMHIVVSRVARIALSGPPPECCSAPYRADVLAYLAAELTWDIEHAPERYAVLNACRAATYLHTGAIFAKVAGGEWASSRWPEYASHTDR